MIESILSLAYHIGAAATADDPAPSIADAIEELEDLAGVDGVESWSPQDRAAVAVALTLIVRRVADVAAARKRSKRVRTRARIVAATKGHLRTPEQVRDAWGR